jgi:hypothetical protein
MTTPARRSPGTVGLAVVAIFIVAAAGLCVFDTDGHEHDAAGLDLCTSIAAAALGSVLFAALGVIGSATDRSGWGVTPAAVSILDPPPRR